MDKDKAKATIRKTKEEISILFSCIREIAAYFEEEDRNRPKWLPARYNEPKKRNPRSKASIDVCQIIKEHIDKLKKI